MPPAPTTLIRKPVIKINQSNAYFRAYFREHFYLQWLLKQILDISAMLQHRLSILNSKHISILIFIPCFSFILPLHNYSHLFLFPVFFYERYSSYCDLSCRASYLSFLFLSFFSFSLFYLIPFQLPSQYLLAFSVCFLFILSLYLFNNERLLRLLPRSSFSLIYLVFVFYLFHNFFRDYILPSIFSLFYVHMYTPCTLLCRRLSYPRCRIRSRAYLRPRLQPINEKKKYWYFV